MKTDEWLLCVRNIAPGSLVFYLFCKHTKVQINLVYLIQLIKYVSRQL